MAFIDDLTISICSFNYAEELEAIIALMNEYIADPMGGGKPIEGLNKLRLIDGLNQPHAIVFLAEYEGKIIGLANCFETFATFTVKKTINIHDLIVHQPFRGKGVGRKMLQAIEAEARKRNCSKVTLEVREDNANAQLLYHSEGFRDCSPRMWFWRKMIE